MLELELGSVWLEAEISNLAMPVSGHWYFSLKDSRAQIRCAMFKGANSRVTFRPKDGDKLLVRAKVSLYEPRGDYQLIVEHIEHAGDGALRVAFEQLKAELMAEGLFAEEHKQEIPKLPNCIGVVTSSTGAAIHDILTVLNRRFPAIPVIIYPSMVQGEHAAKTIAEAISIANQRNECDVLIVARGGGSLEDLWCFNEECVARAIFASTIPIVSGVGHEVDVTIADFVADHRAATPSAAAEFVSPSKTEYHDYLNSLQQSLVTNITSILKQNQQHCYHLAKRLKHPDQKLQEQMQRIDYLHQMLSKNMLYKLSHTQQKLMGLVRTLDAFSPLATLARGYSITKKSDTIIKSAKSVKLGDTLSTMLEDGCITSKITDIYLSPPKS
jgi:exodeoxyribonuclease VII large subunit